MNGADSAKNSHSEVVETTRTPAIFSSAQTITTASADHHSAISFRKPGEQALEVQHEQRGINRHVEDEATSDSHAS